MFFLQIYLYQKFICWGIAHNQEFEQSKGKRYQNLNYKLIDKQLSMGDTCSFARFSKDFEVPQLKERNSYGQTNEIPDDKVVMSIFSQSYDENRKSNVISMIKSNRDQLFEDDKFKMIQKQSLRLSVLFNFETNRTRIYSKKQQTDITSFIQLNVEFTYLTSVFYLLCKRQAKSNLLAKLVQNQQTNNYGAYSTSLYCNGQPHQVIIDDRMPTHNDNFLYLRIVKGIQLWPLILEKAWCKQIGSYQRAKGLSPQDAFEQITGIPAYTYTIKANNRSSIKTVLTSAISKGYWITLIARNGLSDLTNRQVFYLESILGDEYTIISPFVSYSFQDYSMNRRGQVKVRQQDIFSHFEHIVVGFYKPSYVPISYPVTSKSREQIIFEINVINKEDISIRFNQLYHGYLDINDRTHYKYSSLMMELYEFKEVNGVKSSIKIVDFCQGCNRSLAGTRSSQCAASILQSLQGKYLLRIEVGWNYQSIINKGNLVVYGSQNNVQVGQLKNSDILFKEIYPIIFQTEGNRHILHQHNLEVITFDKEKSTLILFHNVTNNEHHFQVDFTSSINVRLRGKQIKGPLAFIRLQPDQKEIIEVSPQDLKKIMQIKNFEINKIPFK